MKKKAQMHMTETISVIFIFFVLIVFGLIFYAKFQQGSITEKQEELLGKRAIETLLKVLYSPELICTNQESEPEQNCFDLAKIKVIYTDDEDNFFQREENEDYYFNLFSYSKITLTEVYPNFNEKVLYNKLKPEWESLKNTHYIISIKDNSNKYMVGYLTVGVYS